MAGDPQSVVADFHRLFYAQEQHQTWGKTRWLGVPVVKCPFDLWVYQEILHRRRPDVVIETGTASGGSAYFLACMCDLIGSGRVITIDVDERDDYPQHDRITYLTGSSVAPEIVAAVSESIGPGEQVMVVLDSDHHRDHVLHELRAYAPLVTPGNYLIVEDTNVNGNPVAPDHGPGPREAIEAFLGEEAGRGFIVDRKHERLLLTFNPGGFLRRV